MTKPTHAVVVGLGESLFDCFNDRRVLGGAPLNVAIHAHALLRQHQSGEALPATRVGADALGSEVVESLRKRGVSTEFVQRDTERPTGQVRVTLDSQGVAEYVFESDSAWDAIEYEPLQELAARCDAVAFGTLAQRSVTSRSAIQAFLQAAEHALRLFDVNLRQEYFSPGLLRDSLELATAVKVNEEELAVLASLLGDESIAGQPVPEVAEAIRSTFDLGWVAVTLGPKGVAMSTDSGWYDAEDPPPMQDADPHADTVGAGDACCAALLTGTLLGWPTRRILRLANATGCFVASRPGATPTLPAAILEMMRGT